MSIWQEQQSSLSNSGAELRTTPLPPPHTSRKSIRTCLYSGYIFYKLFPICAFSYTFHPHRHSQLFLKTIYYCSISEPADKQHFRLSALTTPTTNFWLITPELSIDTFSLKLYTVTLCCIAVHSSPFRYICFILYDNISQALVCN